MRIKTTDTADVSIASIATLSRKQILFASLLLTIGTTSYAEISVASYAIAADGQFTVSNGNLHYWQYNSGYNVYNLETQTNENIGLPPLGTSSNSYGDPFGVYDSSNGLFYSSAFYTGAGADIYVYNTNMSQWQTEGPNGISLTNAYGAQPFNNELYVSGLIEPWSGAYGQDTYIFSADLTANSGEVARHDMLIKGAFNSAYVAVSGTGDVYYVPFSIDGSTALYRWSAEQVAGVKDDLYAEDPVDNLLTIDDGELLALLPGGGNGLAVDDAGNVFFSTNGGPDGSIVGMYNPDSEDDYDLLYSEAGYGWWGALAIDGDFLEGDSLYFSPYGSITELTLQVPEPSAAALLVALVTCVPVVLRRRRNLV